MVHEAVERKLTTPAEAAQRLLGALDGVLARGGGPVARLRRADTSVAFHLGGSETITCLLDRSPIEVHTNAPAEIDIEIPLHLIGAFVQGRLPMTAMVIEEAVRTRGPVRRYLRIDPILRNLLLEMSGADGKWEASPEPGPMPSGAPIGPDLLAIETRRLHKSFGGNQVLRGLDITIPEGVVSVVIGPSGTGKSVLLQHIIGILKPDQGDVLLHGRALSQMQRSEVLALRRGIGVMFQDGALFSAMDLYDNVAFPLRQHTDLSEAELREVVMYHLANVGLAAAAHRMPSELSGGMKKRAGLARALVLDPGVVLCDEPDSGLDPVRTALLGDLLLAQHAQYGGTMVVVTHNVMLAKLIADHVSVIWRGKVLESGLAERVFESQTPFVRQFLQGLPDGPLSMDA